MACLYTWNGDEASPSGIESGEPLRDPSIPRPVVGRPVEGQARKTGDTHEIIDEMTSAGQHCGCGHIARKALKYDIVQAQRHREPYE